MCVFLAFATNLNCRAFYDLCDVFVLASVDEPWGLAGERGDEMRDGPIIVSR